MTNIESLAIRSAFPADVWCATPYAGIKENSREALVWQKTRKNGKLRDTV